MIRLLALLLAALATPVAAAQTQWVASWASAQMIPGGDNALPAADLDDATIRQVVRLSVGGKRLRVLVSNAFGTAPLLISAAHVARSADVRTPQLVAGSGRVLTFNGSGSVTIPAGAAYLSDPVDLAVVPLTSLAVSLHLPRAPEVQTSHPGSRATSWLVHGDATAADTLAGARRVTHWFQLAAVQVEASARTSAVVALGDSITDGRGATTDGNDRWTDRLADRLQGRVAVLNAGIGGNRLLLDGLGPNALARFDRDVVAQPGVRHVIVLEGVNDLGTLTREAPQPPAVHAALVAAMTGSYAQVVARARAAGIAAIGATVMPYGGSEYYHPDAANETDRQAVNRWIRRPGNFDAVIDFDALTRDPAHPDRLRADYDSGDHLHPSAAGYRAMADAVPLKLFARR